mgnify:CR=1 FL=1
MDKKVILRKGKEESLQRFHPWIFSGAVMYLEGNPEEGDLVEVVNSQGSFLCKGHWQVGSIAVRVLTFDDEPVDDDFCCPGRSSSHRTGRFQSGKHLSSDTWRG